MTQGEDGNKAGLVLRSSGKALSLSRFALNPPIRTKVSLFCSGSWILPLSHPIKRLSAQSPCNALFLTSEIPVPPRLRPPTNPPPQAPSPSRAHSPPLPPRAQPTTSPSPPLLDPEAHWQQVLPSRRPGNTPQAATTGPRVSASPPGQLGKKCFAALISTWYNAFAIGHHGLPYTSFSGQLAARKSLSERRKVCREKQKKY